MYYYRIKTRLYVKPADDGKLWITADYIKDFETESPAAIPAKELYQMYRDKLLSSTF